MNLRKYLLDKIPQIAFSVFGIIIAFFMLNAFKVQNDLKFALLVFPLFSAKWRIFPSPFILSAISFVLLQF